MGGTHYGRLLRLGARRDSRRGSAAGDGAATSGGGLRYRRARESSAQFCRRRLASFGLLARVTQLDGRCRGGGARMVVRRSLRVPTPPTTLRDLHEAD